MSTNKNAIIVFVRYPAEGKVKTRLASSLGNGYAVEIYKLIAKTITNSIKQVPNSYKYIFYSDEEDKSLIKKWLGIKFFYSLQEGNDLGEKMKNAFEKVFNQGVKKAIIVGTDIPDLSKDIINEAISELDNYDVVISPTNDGGYYLLGMKKHLPSLFENILFSTNTVYAETISKIKDLGLSYKSLKVLQDIDTEKDLLNWILAPSNERIESSLKKEILLIYNTIQEKDLIKCALK